MTEKAYEAEQEQIEADFANERTQLKESLLAELLSRRAALLEERERLAQGDGGAHGNGVDEDDSIIPSAGLMEQPTSQTGTARQSSRQKVKAAAGTTSGKAGDLLVIPSATTSSKRRAQQSATSVLGISTMLPDWEIYEDLNAISRAAGDDAGGLGGAGGRRNAPRKHHPAPATSAQSAATSTTTTTKKRSNATDSATASPLPKQARSAPTTTAAAVTDEPAIPEKNIYIEGGALWYCGSHYPKGSSFTISFGQDSTKGFPVSLSQVNASEIQVKKHSDGSKVRIPLEDLLSGSAMILAQDSQ